MYFQPSLLIVCDRSEVCTSLSASSVPKLQVTQPEHSPTEGYGVPQSVFTAVHTRLSPLGADGDLPIPPIPP